MMVTNDFNGNEKLFRAVFPREMKSMFWRSDKKISSAALEDTRGLSVDRAGGREDREAIDVMRAKFIGHIVSVTCAQCTAVGAIVKHCPNKKNRFHSEIHGSATETVLDLDQREELAEVAILEA